VKTAEQKLIQPRIAVKKRPRKKGAKYSCEDFKPDEYIYEVQYIYEDIEKSVSSSSSDEKNLEEHKIPEGSTY